MLFYSHLYPPPLKFSLTIHQLYLVLKQRVNGEAKIELSLFNVWIFLEEPLIVFIGVESHQMHIAESGLDLDQRLEGLKVCSRF